MLTAIRTKASSWIVKILFLLLILTFGLWGIGDIFRVGNKTADLAKVGPVSISAQEFQTEYQRELGRFGGQIDSETAKQLGLHKQLMDAMVSRALLQIEGERRGLAISDDQVRAAILFDRSFYNDFGQFDRTRFDFALRQAGLTEAGYSNLIRNELTRQQLLSSFADGVEVPRDIANRLYVYRAEKRVGEVLTLPTTAAGTIRTPSDDELKSFYEANKNPYQAPEYRAATIVVLDPADIGKDITIPDADVRKAFDDNIASYGVPEKRSLRQVVFSDEATAAKFETAIKAGKDFDSAAKDLNVTVTDLGTLTKAEMPIKELADPAFALSADGVSAPVNSALGWHVVQVTTIEPGKEAVFEEVKDKIRDDLAKAKAVDSIIAVGNELQDKLAAGTPLAEVAKDLSLKTVTIDAMDARGRDRDGKAIDGIDENVVQIVAATEEGQDSGLVDLPDGRSVVVHVNAVTPAAPHAFDDVKDQVKTAWVEEERTKALQALADKLVQELDAGAKLETLATSVGGAVKTSQPVTRDGSDPEAGLDAATTAKLFTLAPEKAASFVTNSGIGVIRLTKIEKPDPQAAKDEVDRILDDARAQMIGDLTAQYGLALRQTIPVTVDEAELDRLP